MIKDVTGANGQILTTWGRDLDDDRWVGPTRSVQWECTCRCARTIKGDGFGTAYVIVKAGWVEFDGELFCSIRCAALQNPVAVAKYGEGLRQQSVRATRLLLEMFESLASLDTHR